MDWHDMEETHFRASQICRVLGNPKTYAMVKELSKGRALTPAELSQKVNRSLHTVCVHLRHLREVNVVRFQKKGRGTVYRLKSSTVDKVLKRLEQYVEEMREARE